MLGHQKGVWTICLLSNNLLCSGSYDKTIKLWNIKDKKTENKWLNSLEGHSKEIRSIIQLKDKRICSSSEDGTIKLWG